MTSPIHVGEGYCACACRDCMEIAIGKPGKTLCWECKEAGCEPCDCTDPEPRPGFRCPHGECQAPGAYGGWEEDEDEADEGTPGA
jgi:hypothetical protein